MKILGIETSCDETAAAVVVEGRVARSNVISSQIALHQPHGGVVPELAARGHITAIVPVIEAALAEAGITAREIDAVAVTDGPGLAGSLLVGVNVAKAMAYALDCPLVAINHLEAHIYANWILQPNSEPVPPPSFPLICLLVSGGHTELILMTGHGHYRHLGRTLDDAAGEAFDKGARLLALGYPGGPAMQHAATRGDPARFDLPRAWLGESADFSFSGLKTALLRMSEPYRVVDPATPSEAPSGPSGPFPLHRPFRFRDDAPIADFAASYQAAMVEVLAIKTARAARDHQANTVLLAGGVAANIALRDRLSQEVAAIGIDPSVLRYPPVELCTDNAAMIASAGFFALRRGDQAGWEADVHPRLALQ